MNRSHFFGNAAIAAALLIVGCGGGNGQGLDGGAGTSGSGAAGTGAGGTGAGGRGGSGPVGPTRDFDILFMVDHSSSMIPAQQQLSQNFPAFMTALAGLPGGLPNVHIAVVSADMGAGDGSIYACDGNGRAGIFQYTPRAPCTASPLTGGATYIVNENGQANYTGTIEAAFSCLANLGDTGCGLEQQLLSVSRALGADGPAPPAENQGFLRRNANLVIVLISNEDDCSNTLGAASPLFGTNPNSLAGPFGPVQNFRCNEFGHTCAQGAPNRNAPGGQQTATVAYNSCVSNEQSAYLKSVGSFVQEIKSLKQAPDQQIIVAGFLGVSATDPSGPIPYTVEWSPAPLADTGPWPRMRPACGMVVTGMLFADPAVRLAQFVRAFGDNGLVFSICESNYGPALQMLAQRMAQRLPP